MVDAARLKDELTQDEGKVLHVYRDSLGWLTCGIGHSVTRRDGLWLGERISEQRCGHLYTQDAARAVSDCRLLLPDYDALPEEAQLVLANMSFNLGNKLAGFVRFLAAIEHRDWRTAAAEGRDSLWHRQLPLRSERLMRRLEALAEAEEETHD